MQHFTHLKILRGDMCVASRLTEYIDTAHAYAR